MVTEESGRYNFFKIEFDGKYVYNYAFIILLILKQRIWLIWKNDLWILIICILRLIENKFSALDTQIKLKAQ